jgi:methylglutaconyl-CoA hydratase
MAEAPVLVERRGGAAIVTLNRPDQRNALSRALLLELERVGAELGSDSELRVVVLTGAGDRAFCAGADLKERRSMSLDDVREQLGLYRRSFGWLESSPFPTVAAFNGAALGGGLELALCCDFRVARTGIELGLPETSLGILPAAGGTQRLPRLIGENRAKELILFGTRVTAERALELGLVNAIAPTSEPLLDFTLSWLAPILDGAPIAQRAALRAVRAASELSLDAGLKFEFERYEECLASEDRLEALAAFTEKRKPRFQGR